MDENLLRIHFRNFANGIYTFEQFKAIIADSFTIKTQEEVKKDEQENSELVRLTNEKNNLSYRLSNLESEKSRLEWELYHLKVESNQIISRNTINNYKN